MEAGYLEEVKQDLAKVDAKLNQHFKLRSGTARDYAHLELSPLDKYLRPALVLLFARLFGHASEKSVYLASIVQLIFMSANIHLGIPEEKAGEEKLIQELDPRDGTQLPVLVGDYLYGKFFSLLCEAEILDKLKPLSEIICTMNEGAVVRLKGTAREGLEGSMETIRKETAELISGACRLGATLGQASEEQIDIATKFGLNFGIGYGLMEHSLNTNLALEYENSALNELNKLKDSLPLRALQSLTKAVFRHDLPKLQWMVG